MGIISIVIIVPSDSRKNQDFMYLINVDIRLFQNRLLKLPIIIMLKKLGYNDYFSRITKSDGRINIKLLTQEQE